MEGQHAFALGLHAASTTDRVESSTGAYQNNYPQGPMYQNITLPRLQAHDEADVLCSMNFWYARACFSFSVDYATFLRTRVTTQAHNCDYLMGAVLASTTLQQAHESRNTASRRALLVAAIQHQNRAIAGLKQNLDALGRDNCDNVFLTTVFLMLCAFASSIISDTETTSVTDIMLRASKFLQGAQNVGTQCIAWLFEGRALEIFGTRAGCIDNINSRTDTPRTLQNLHDHIQSMSSLEERHILDQAVVALDQVFAGKVEEIPWVLSAGPKYFALLQRGHVLSTAVLVHYGVVLAQREDMWWAAYTGRRIVKELSATLAGYGDTYMAIVDWCRMQTQQ